MSAVPLFGGAGAVRAIVKRASSMSGISEKIILSRARHRDAAMVRFAIVYTARRTTRASYPRIGGVLNRDHTTVIHAERRAVDLVQTDPEFAEFCNALRDQ